MIKLIALCGVKKSGKNTAAEVLKDVLGKENTEERSIAIFLKQTACKIFNLELNQVNEQHLKEKVLDNPLILDSAKLQAFFNEFGLLEQNLNSEKNKIHIGKRFSTPRQLLQYLGTDILISIDPLIHVKQILKSNTEKVIIVTDMRFLAELEYFSKELDSKNFIPLFINNDKAESLAKNDLHPTEQEVFTFCSKCIKVDNNKQNLVSLRENLIQILKEKKWSN